MDSLHAIGFYVSATVSVCGALVVALLPSRGVRGAALALTGLGIAGLELSLSAGFAGLVTLVAFVGAGLLVSGARYRALELPETAVWRQVGAVGAAGLFALLAYAAFRGDFVHATFYGGQIGTAAAGRFLLDHDALATEALAALVVVALAGAAAGWRSRERNR